VTADLQDFSASDSGDQPSSDGDRRWNVTVSGTATNGASAAVRAVQLAVTVHASNGRASSHDVTVAQTIGPGATVGWSGRFRVRSSGQPDGGSAQVAVTGWSWANSSLASCPT